MPLDSAHAARDPAHHRGRVAGARANFEHVVARLNLGKLDHACDDIRLRDGLPRLDGKRRILVGEFLQRPRHEGLARHLAHGFEDVVIGDAARLQMPRDHDLAIGGAGIVLGVGVAGRYSHAHRTNAKADPFLDLNQIVAKPGLMGQGLFQFPPISAPTSR